MILHIFYFSGTGNTHYVAEYLARRLAHLPLEVRLQAVDQRPAAGLGGFDLLAVGFPVYACDAPPFFRRELERLRPGMGRGAFVFCTKGAYAGRADWRILRQLAAQGYTPMAAASILMPGSDGLAMVGKDSWFARWARNKDYDHLKSADRLSGRIEEVVVRMRAGAAPEDCAVRLPARLGGGPFTWLWRQVYERFAMPFRDRFYADERCNQCRLCQRICPAHNISLHDGQVHFADRCRLCLRCLHQCPQEAIQFGPSSVDKFRWRGPRGRFQPLRLYGGDRLVETSEEQVL